jgi:hypothetical protein
MVHTAVVLMYYDQRVRKEGFDVQMMLPALGEDALTLSFGPRPPAGSEGPVTVLPPLSEGPYRPLRQEAPPPPAPPATAPPEPVTCPACGQEVPGQLAVCPQCLQVLQPSLEDLER